MNYCPTSSKIPFIIFNFISLLVGGYVIWSGLFQHFVEFFDTTKKPLNSDVSKDHLFIFDTEYIIIGTMVCLSSIFGLISVAMKSTRCLKLYAAINVIVIVGSIITTSIGCLKFEDTASKSIEKLISDNFNHDKYNERIRMVNELQGRFHCCGNTGPENYAQAEFLPSSCCLNKNCTLGIVYDGCNTKILKIVNEYGRADFTFQKLFLIFITVFAAVLEFVGAAFAIDIVLEKIESSNAGNSEEIWRNVFTIFHQE